MIALVAGTAVVTSASSLTPDESADRATAPVVTGLAATDGTNSAHADRLVDGVLGTDDSHSWLNPQAWTAGAYPMTAEIDLGRPHRIEEIRYFVGNISQGWDHIRFESSASASGDDFQPLTDVDDDHRWRNWRSVPVEGVTARRLRVRFDDRYERFNVSEIQIHGTPAATGTNPEPTSSSTAGPEVTGPESTTTQPGGTEPTNPESSTTEPSNPASTTTEPATSTSTSTSTSPSTSTPTSTSTTGGPTNPGPTGPGTETEQPRSAAPGPGIERAHGFGQWPSDHLSDACRDLHDRYWIQGPNVGVSDDPSHPENRAYHTWHPAVTAHPDTGERCDFGHEHGHNPTLAPDDVFELSGGWPAFGYAAATAAGPRHEDHVGHKVTVAHFRASVGNAAGPEPIYDAGFECDWLSKIHQGSWSMDAFSNHLHEYYVTLRCYDGRDAAGTMTGDLVGTAFSIKLVYTYGAPNGFIEENCSGGGVFSSSILTDPDGQPAPMAMQAEPASRIPGQSRGFTCSSGVIWQDMVDTVQSVDLWTDFVAIERNDGSTAITVQPYYIIKNPARIIEAFSGQPSQVVRTIDLCYDDEGNRGPYQYCADAPASIPSDWIGWKDPRSPFNGTLRAIHFKAAHQQNAGGPESFCTDAFGRAVDDMPPCETGHLLQRASAFDNHWNDGRYSHNGRSGNIQGSIWAEDPHGNRFGATPNADGSYTTTGIGHEFIIDNRFPDDDMDGVPDGANIRGQN